MFNLSSHTTRARARNRRLRGASNGHAATTKTAQQRLVARSRNVLRATAGHQQSAKLFGMQDMPFLAVTERRKAPEIW